MKDMKISEYLNILASNSPTPGGGNVSAFCGGLASSLATMVCNLTIGKKKYLDVQDQITQLKNDIEPFIDKFLSLAQKDNESFDNVMKAFSLPKDTDEQKELRKQEIEKATIGAADIPKEVILTINQLLEKFITISEIGNQNSLSDIGVALLLLKTSAQGAYLNVLINISSLSDKNFADQYIQELNPIYNNIVEKVDNVYKNIVNKITG